MYNVFMNDEIISDLKQFIATTISQQTASLEQKMDKGFEEVDKRFEQVDKRFEAIDKRFDEMDDKIDITVAGIGETITELSDNINAVTKDHEHRISRLETKVA